MNQVLNFEPAFAAFMAKAQAQVATRYQAQGYGNAAPVLTFMEGNRYVRLVKTSYGQRSAFGFVDKQNGNVLKAAGWKTLGKRGGGSWDRPSRRRIDKGPTCQKQLWEMRVEK